MTSFTRIPKPPVLTAEGLHFPSEVEVLGRATVTDTVDAILTGRRALLRICTVDPSTRARTTAEVDMGAPELDHLIARLSTLRLQLRGMGE